jgi:hypothetical protein
MAESNGRVYDPTIARFLSPDPMLQSPNNALNYNRYTYCLNNPLLYTDPSGMSWFSDLGDWVGDQWDGMWTGLDNFAKWADKTDWFPSSGGFSTSVDMYNYNDKAGPMEEYSSGMPSYSEIYLGDMYKVSGRGIPLFPSEPIDVSSIRLASQSYILPIVGRGISVEYSSMNYGLKEMQKLNSENFGYELLPTQYVYYSYYHDFTLYGGGRDITITVGKNVYIYEKYNYFIKGSVVKEVFPMSKGEVAFPEFTETVNRYQISYSNNMALKAMTAFDSYMTKTAYGKQDTRCNIILRSSLKCIYFAHG